MGFKDGFFERKSYRNLKNTVRAREHLYYMQISGTGIQCHATIPRQDFDLHLL